MPVKNRPVSERGPPGKGLRLLAEVFQISQKREWPSVACSRFDDRHVLFFLTVWAIRCEGTRD